MINNFFDKGYHLCEFTLNSNFDNLKEKALSHFKQIDEGYITSSIEDINKDERFFDKFSMNGITYFGCGLEYRYNRGFGSYKDKNRYNWLIGKSATLNQFHSIDIFSTILNDNIFINNVKDIVELDNISFLEGRLSALYPGFTGNSLSYISETPRFFTDLRDSFKFRKEGGFVFRIDVPIYNDKIAPLTIINNSHENFLEYNSYFSESFGISKNKDATILNPEPHKINNRFIPNEIEYYDLIGIYDELIPSFDQLDIEKTEINNDKPIIFNSNLLISQQSNNSSNSIKVFASLYFSNRGSGAIKYFDFNIKNVNRFYNSIKNRDLINNFNSKNINVIKREVKSNSLKRIIIKKLKNYISSGKNLFVNTNNDPTKKEYLNVGAGPLWRNPNCISLDYDKELSEVSFDLESKTPLPFEDNRFKGVYTSHNLEHLKNDSVYHVISEIFRCLKPGGVLRITVPDIIGYFEEYKSKNVLYYDWMRGKDTYMYDSW